MRERSWGGREKGEQEINKKGRKENNEWEEKIEENEEEQNNISIMRE
jgi:hypothetical protein